MGRSTTFAAVGAGLVVLAGQAMAKTYALSITGDAGTRYRGSCTVDLSVGTATIDLDGTVPFEQRFDGEGLSCEVQADGRIAAQIDHEGGRSRSETSGGTARVRAR
jgi:hypothetical protein